MITQKVIALIGNPNSGKTSLFNELTGLHQHTSNFPGTTVSLKSGLLSIPGEANKTKLIDFPGAYSFFANSEDERINVEILTNPNNENYPDLVVYVADITKLSRHFLLASQIIDLKIPTIVVLNMYDMIDDSKVNIKKIENLFGVPVIPSSTRSGLGIDTIRKEISNFCNHGEKDFIKDKSYYQLSDIEEQVSISNSRVLHTNNKYLAKLISHHASWLEFLDNDTRKNILDNNKKHGFIDLNFQIKETMDRYNSLEPSINSIHDYSSKKPFAMTDKIDNWLTHRIAGPIIFFAIMLFIFQAIYSWAGPPMDWIESGFGILGEAVSKTLGKGWISDLIVEGVIAGLAGVFVFLPQIIMLFFFLAVLEESGYMSRVVYMFDGLLKKFGMNGRSVVALVSAGACSIPAIMSTRTISNPKERLITIMVTPLISCSARLPVYTALIGFVVPSSISVGPFNAQGLAFMGLYLLGILAALLSALVFKFILKSKEKSTLMLELPQYKKPLFKNVFYYVSTKVGAFIKEAGKIILLVAIVLWFLASYGPSNNIKLAEMQAIELATQRSFSQDETQNLINSKRIEASYAGILGKFIEPAVKPIGLDWKMGIALITSFAAREVFVGTMATIYSIGEGDDVMKVRDRMALQVNPLTGAKVYTLATALSLLMFYVFALQCLPTLAVTYKETKSIKWSIIQFTFMTVLAYLASFVVFNLFLL